ncbi:MAG: hypothetical protein M5T61_00935 [Acidimicrobiia bacterium]|nr:hypothetical protein [Acidimicrobiia bacterium]
MLVQLVVEDKATRSAHGVVIAYDHMPEHGVCFLAFQRFGASRDGGEMFLGMFHFVEYLFQRWTLRKLYVDLPEYNADLIGDGLGVITEEGRLREFSYYDGRYWDRIFYAIDRDLWEHKAQVWHLYLTDGLAPDVR